MDEDDWLELPPPSDVSDADSEAHGEDGDDAYDVYPPPGTHGYT
jgi:hypothetical protein